MQIQQFSFILTGIIFMLILYILIGKLFEHKHIHVLHETGVGILIGLAFGFLAAISGSIQEVDFNQQIFFYGLLPPMIFAGGYNLKKQNFGKNFKYILLFGLLGTVMVFGLTFFMTYVANQQGWFTITNGQGGDAHLQNPLVIKYSATISATDSVAALTLISPIQFPKLFSIIFGQGMVNDAVAIILFKVVGGIFDDIQEHPMDGGQIASTIAVSFIQTVVFSIAIGLFSALICSLIFKHMRFLVKSEITQVVITYIFGILSYAIAQGVHMSGVITVLICGVTLAHYNFYNLSVGGMHATMIVCQFVSFLAEAIVFVYLGISVVYYVQNFSISLSFIGIQLVICVISRTVTIFLLSLIFKLLFKKWTVSARQLSIVSIAGTIRGSVALALILTIQGHQQSKQTELVKSGTLIIVCLTTIVLGGLMPFFIKFFLGQQVPQRIQQDLPQPQVQKQTKKPGFFKNFNQTKLKPFFIYKYEINKPKFKQYKRAMKQNSKNDQTYDNLMKMQASFINNLGPSVITHQQANQHNMLSSS